MSALYSERKGSKLLQELFPRLFMIDRQGPGKSSKTVYLAVVISQETELEINKSGAVAHPKV